MKIKYEMANIFLVTILILVVELVSLVEKGHFDAGIFFSNIIDISLDRNAGNLKVDT